MNKLSLWINCALLLSIGIVFPSNLSALSDPEYYVAFSMLKGGNLLKDELTYEAIHIMKLDGTDLRELTVFPAGSENDPVWSPDAKSLVFSSNKSSIPEFPLYDRNLAADQIYVMNLDNANPIRVTASTRNQGSSINPSWSPDGRHIAFIREANLFLVKPDGENERLLVRQAYDSAWSLDGCCIAFTGLLSSKAGDKTEIGIIDIATKTVVNLTNHPYSDINPVWSPDGQWIAFASDRAGSRDIYRVRPDGSELTQLTSDSSADEDMPRWSPDERWIAYWVCSTEECLYTGIHIMTSDGQFASQVPVITGSFFQWLPDSTGLLFYRYFDYANYSAIYMLDTACMDNQTGCREADLRLIPNTEKPSIATNTFSISPIKLSIK